MDAENYVTVKVRVMNPWDKRISVRQNTVLGHAQRVEDDELRLICEEEISCEKENNSWACQCQFHKDDDSSEVARRYSQH